MNKIDLHIHSSFSDGSEALEKIIEMVEVKKLEVISITDHDTFKAYDFIPEKIGGCEVIKGIELSTYDYDLGRRIDILAYKFPAITTHLDQICQESRAAVDTVSQWQIEQLQQAGYNIAKQEVRDLAKRSGTIYKQHIMDALIIKGYTDSIYSDLYKKLFKNGGICQRNVEFIDTKKAIEAIHSDGGIAILAHPNLSGILDNLEKYINYGVDGIETYHSSQSEMMIEVCHHYAKKHGLLETGGSDYHGRYGNEPMIGDVNKYMDDAEVKSCLMKN